jgi:hypothetical protein
MDSKVSQNWKEKTGERNNLLKRVGPRSKWNTYTFGCLSGLHSRLIPWLHPCQDVRLPLSQNERRRNIRNTTFVRTRRDSRTRGHNSRPRPGGLRRKFGNCCHGLLDRKEQSNTASIKSRTDQARNRCCSFIRIYRKSRNEHKRMNLRTLSSFAPSSCHSHFVAFLLLSFFSTHSQ